MLDKLKQLMGRGNKNKDNGRGPDENMSRENSRQASVPRSNIHREAGSMISNRKIAVGPSPCQFRAEQASEEAPHRANSGRPNEPSDPIGYNNRHDKGTSFHWPGPGLTEDQMRERPAMSEAMSTYLDQQPIQEPFTSQLVSDGFQGQPAVAPGRAEHFRSQASPSSTGAVLGSATDSDQEHDV